jgi:hypothetical protein
MHAVSVRVRGVESKRGMSMKKKKTSAMFRLITDQGFGRRGLGEGREDECLLIDVAFFFCHPKTCTV